MSNHVSSIIEASPRGLLVDIECRITAGLPAIVIVGYANKSIEEAKERLRGAFSSCKLFLPRKRITLNLAPGDIPKDGTSFDLAMAVAILLAEQPLLAKQIEGSVIVGELSLDGSVRPVRGIIGKLLAARQQGIRRCFIPAGNLTQAQLIPDLELCTVTSLTAIYEHLLRLAPIAPVSSGLLPKTPPEAIRYLDLQTIAGQTAGKRALEIAAAGGHHLLLTGPPGMGKTMLGKALAGVLPPLHPEEMLEVTHLHSLASSRFDEIIRERPVRSPHSTVSLPALIGGGNPVSPGEISLSHQGVLFLDELPEFKRPVIESLRQPLEDGHINLARGRQSVSFPARFILVATANPCPCGYFGTPRCRCPAYLILQYQRKISGPVLDRIDLTTEVDPAEHQKILSKPVGTQTTAHVRRRVIAARAIQHRRQSVLNSQLNNNAVRRHANLTSEAEHTLNHNAQKANLSARAYLKTLKVARTIADLAGMQQIEAEHIIEAFGFRPQD